MWLNGEISDELASPNISYPGWRMRVLRKGKAMGSGDALTQQVEKAIEEYWPKVQEYFQKTVGPKALEIANNDNICEELFVQVYKTLPLPVRLVVRKKFFIKYCFTNRDKLISATTTAKGDS